jgi:hypothetical protein|tara:strand:+ start:44 stop:679 length:636 start_codon:yes stop_codon:yes gene_type:complete
MIEKILIPFCGYPIYKICTGTILTPDELGFIYSLNKRPHKSNYYAPAKLSLTATVNMLESKELKRIKDIIWKQFSDYVDEVLEIENQFYICNSWATVQEKGFWHPKHNHPNSVFGSVFYAQAENSILSFSVNKCKLMEGFFMHWKIKNHNFFNSSSWDVPVNTGDMIIFPGEIAHESPVHGGPNDRIAIGTSYFPKGEFGSTDQYNLMKIS